MWDLKPLVNGKDIMNVLQLKSGGPLVREWVIIMPYFVYLSTIQHVLSFHLQ